MMGVGRPSMQPLHSTNTPHSSLDAIHKSNSLKSMKIGAGGDASPRLRSESLYAKSIRSKIEKLKEKVKTESSRTIEKIVRKSEGFNPLSPNPSIKNSLKTRPPIDSPTLAVYSAGL